MAGKTVNPTRMELTRLKGRLKTARRGHKLLKDKRDELMKQFLEIVRRNRQLRAKVEQGLKEANDAFTVAAAVMGPEMMEQSWLWMEQNKNRPNDTRKPAAYIVKAALDPEKLVAGSSVWCFSDIFEKFSEIPEEFHGGFGLLTHSGIPKPAYYAMKMLAELCDNRIVLDKDASDGEVGIAAFD